VSNVFICYARQNKRDIEQLVEHLRVLGYHTWHDSSPHGGQAWWEKILRQIAECDTFIAIVSHDALSSSAWRRELDWAEALGKPVIPVALEPITFALPIGLSRRQIIDYSDPHAALTLAGALATLPVAPPLTSPLPDPPPAPLAYLTNLIELMTEGQALNHDQQRQILNQLEPALYSVDPEERSGGRDVLERLSRRDDLFADVERVINRMRTSAGEATAPAPTSYSPAPAPPTVRQAGGPVPVGAAPRQPTDSPPVDAQPPPRSYLESVEPTSIFGPEKRKRDRKKQRGSKEEKKKRRRSQPSRDASKVADDRVSSSVFAPPAVERGDTFFVQVFAHLPEQATRVEAIAQTYDSAARPRASFGLDSRVKQDERLTFELRLPGLNVDDRVQSLVWTGQPGSVQFGVAVPADFSPRTVVGTVTVSRDSVPMGHIKFKVDICEPEAARDRDRNPERGDLHRYSRAFISYASADRKEVLKRTQMLAGVGIDFFQDLLSLEPGQRWERQLYREIDECDVFFLFWSSAAKKSPWVLKEVQYAMQRNGGSELAPPEILPVIIEGPPPIEAPPELAHLHMNDRMIYFMEPGKNKWLSRLRRRGS
jgi:hypothetical protein